MKRKGFTLIELMIVVAIIGILAAVAIPKFANLIRKSKEAATKGSLGALRSAISIYYGDQEGTYPTTLENDLVPTYISEIPTAKTGISTIADSNDVDYQNDGSGYQGIGSGGEGGWMYDQATSGASAGQVWVDSTQFDTKGNRIHTW
ncbi:MAG: type II secretion system protein [Elusimicrobia bacterium]|nr:type II secretion system protein [Elusimicrobiota bacterium]